MFTGLVEAVGEVARLSRRGPEAQIRVTLPKRLLDDAPLELGESIAIDGVCLTVTTIHADGFDADASSETLAVTTLGALSSGSKVNVERACRPDTRLGGHLVLGHVDGVGRITRLDPSGDAILFGVEAPEALSRYLAPKGSVAVAGVSLTINRLVGESGIEIMLVPHTLAETSLSRAKVGDAVNLEVDVLARYVARQLEWAGLLGPGKRDARLMDALERGGFLR
ncbi:MAG: riboflavin synthase [Myxococcales bacterium]|nr:riboflavin synthase [Myxococcales bacterium]